MIFIQNNLVQRYTYKLSVLAYCFFISVPLVFSQKEYTDKPHFIAVNGSFGKFIVHTPKLIGFEDVYPYGFEIDYSQMLLTDKIKEEYGIYTKWGVALSYVNFDNRNLGYSIHSNFYIEPFLKFKGIFKCSFKIGAGLAYLSEPYDKTNNNTNLTYSTSFAFPLVAGLNGYYNLNDQLSVKGGVTFRHISNGGIKKPNVGINYTMFTLGLEYTPDIYLVTPINSLGVYMQKERRTDAFLGYSQTEDSISKDKSMVFHGIVNHSIKVSLRNAITVGGLFEFMDANEAFESSKFLRASVLFGNEFYIGNIRFGQQLGAYILKGKTAPNFISQNYYIRYVFNKKAIVGVNLKAHGRVAEYLALQLGIVI